MEPKKQEFNFTRDTALDEECKWIDAISQIPLRDTACFLPLFLATRYQQLFGIKTIMDNKVIVTTKHEMKLDWERWKEDEVTDDDNWKFVIRHSLVPGRKIPDPNAPLGELNENAHYVTFYFLNKNRVAISGNEASINTFPDVFKDIGRTKIVTWQEAYDWFADRSRKENEAIPKCTV